MANNHAHMPNQKVKNKRIPNDDAHMHPDNATPKTQSTTNTRHRRSTTKCKRAKPKSGNQIQTCKTQTRNQERRWTGQRKPNKHNIKSGNGTQTNHNTKQIQNDKQEKMNTSGQIVNSTSLVRKGNNQNHKPCLDVFLTHLSLGITTMSSKCSFVE